MRIFAISDTHGELPNNVPECDLLIHAGDIMPDRIGKEWLRHNPNLGEQWMFDIWVPHYYRMLKEGRFKEMAFIWGNHDWTMDTTASISRALPKSMVVLTDHEMTLQGLRVWGSPWSNRFMGWSWMKDPAALAASYKAIPKGIDILISHQPPLGYGSHTLNDGEIGSAELTKELDRIKPKVVICGHIHCGFGIFPYRSDEHTCMVYNVAQVDEAYRLVHKPIEILVPPDLADEVIAPV